MKNAGVIVLLFLAAFTAPAYSARGPGRALKEVLECRKGNIRDGDVLCPGAEKCTVGAIPDNGGTVTASCFDGSVVKVTFSGDKTSVTFKDVNGNQLNNVEAYIKGGNGYCHFKSGPYYTPQTICGGGPCGFSHAIFCVPPAVCDCPAEAQALANAFQVPFDPAGYCPGSTLPTTTITVCGSSSSFGPISGVTTCSGSAVYAAFLCEGSAVSVYALKTFFVPSTCNPPC